jgi:hypothetical protein
MPEEILSYRLYIYIIFIKGQTTIEELLIAKKAKMENNDDIEEGIIN